MSDDIDIWLPLYIGDHLAETIDLSAEEYRGYLLLQMHYWKNKGPIKNDKILLKNITKISVKKLDKILLKFHEKDGLLFHEKLDEHLKKATVSKEKRVTKAKAAASSRWGNNECLEHATSITEALENDAQTMPERCPLKYRYIVGVDTDVSPPTITHTPKTRESKKSANLEELCVGDMSSFLSAREVVGNPITVDVEHELARFRAHYRSVLGKTAGGQTIFDWGAKFEKWLLDEQLKAKNVPDKNYPQRSGALPPGFATARYVAIENKRKRGDVLTKSDRDFVDYCNSEADKKVGVAIQSAALNGEDAERLKAQSYAWHRRTGIHYTKEKKDFLEAHEAKRGPVIDKFQAQGRGENEASNCQ